ncbi:hypothetical protein BKA57DRAFT_166279 [Linnemannia elongata]|nr:hypothetical protein BKA57DRAFT_166279 [Linnemannia elongata]
MFQRSTMIVDTMPALRAFLTRLKSQPMVEDMTAFQTQAVCSSIFFDLRRREAIEDGAVPSKMKESCCLREAVIADSLSSSSSITNSTSGMERTKVANLAVSARRSGRSSFISSGDDDAGVDVDEKVEVSTAAMVRDAVSRCVTPTYLDFLMNDSDNSASDESGADDNDYDLDPAALVASMDPSSPYYRLGSSTSFDELEILQSLVEFGRTPRMFDHTPAASMSFFISPLAISQLARGLWTRSEPACVIIHTRLPQRTSRFDNYPWSDDALRMLNLPNAGGSSLLSEVLSCEMLYRCLGARLAKTEMEIRYFFAYQPMTDYTISLPGLASGFHVGVSVTRAFAYKGAYRRSECRKLLKKKLSGITASTRNVMDERLFKQILHVWVPNGKVARTVQATYRTLSPELTRNSVVVISVVNAAWVFNNRR